mmetsp:Transcript_41370/g.109075  ORF Transcript_41370/g.109075 Transcript_41370/m.109075 type:complete len:205 (+) Transcript_41370:986-1600(+)
MPAAASVSFILPSTVALIAPSPPALAAVIVVHILRTAPLEEEVRKVHLAIFCTHLHRAAPAILAKAKLVPGLKVTEDLFGLLDVILLEAKPQRIRIGGPGLLTSRDDCGYTASREAVVREVHLLYGSTLAHESSECLCAIVVDVILEKLQNPKLVATRAEVQDHSQTIGRQAVLREINLLIWVEAISQWQRLQILICEGPPSVV